MLLTKLALVTCAFYLGLNILMEATVFGIAVWQGGVLFGFRSRTVVTLFFGLMWLLSFGLAWRIVITPILAKIPK